YLQVRYVAVTACGFLLKLRGPRPCTLFPYTTLFRSSFMVIAALIAVGLHINGAYVETWLVALVIYAMIFMGIEMDRIQIRVAKGDRKSTRLNSSHVKSSYAVLCLKKKKAIFRFSRSV